MAALHAIDLSWSYWLDVLRSTLGVPSPDAAAEGYFPHPEERPQFDLGGKSLFCFGAPNDSMGGTRVPPENAGDILAAGAGLWKDFALNNADAKTYARLH